MANKLMAVFLICIVFAAAVEVQETMAVECTEKCVDKCAEEGHGATYCDVTCEDYCKRVVCSVMIYILMK